MSLMAETDLHPLDAMTAAPAHHAILLENEQIRVLDTRLSPGAATPTHTHQWPAALYVICWSDFVRRDADGEIIVRSRDWESPPQPGEAIWGPALQPHSVENVGDTELRIIAVELKSPAAA